MEPSAVTVVQVSDTHLARLPSEATDGPDAGLVRLIELARPSNPDVVLLTGDIADDGSPEAYRRVIEITSRLGAPVLATAGNHDDPDALTALLAASAGLDLGSWRIVLSDTSLPGKIAGEVDVDELLAQLGPDTGKPTLIGLHHPPITTSTHEWFQLTGGEELVAALTRRSDVKIVATGHLHQAFNVVTGGVSYIGCSSSWYSLAHLNDVFAYDDGHVGGVLYELRPDGSWDWRRLPAVATRPLRSPSQ